MTEIHFITVEMPPLEMWVDGGTARDYISQGFEIVEYEPPPAWCSSCFFGKAKIRKLGGPTQHTYSPELVALHKFVCGSLDRHTPSFFTGKSMRRTAASRDFHMAHGLFFADLPNGSDYHGTLMRAGDGEELEDVQARVVDGLWDLSERAGSARKYIEEVAKDVLNWSFISKL